MASPNHLACVGSGAVTGDWRCFAVCRVDCFTRQPRNPRVDVVCPFDPIALFAAMFPRGVEHRHTLPGRSHLSDAFIGSAYPSPFYRRDRFIPEMTYWLNRIYQFSHVKLPSRGDYLRCRRAIADEVIQISSFIAPRFKSPSNYNTGQNRNESPDHDDEDGGGHDDPRNIPACRLFPPLRSNRVLFSGST